MLIRNFTFCLVVIALIMISQRGLADNGCVYENELLCDKDKLEKLAEDYAPILYFHPDEEYFAAPVEHVFPHMTTACGTKNPGGEPKRWLQTKKEMPLDLTHEHIKEGGQFNWLTGIKPGTAGYTETNAPPVYAIVTEKKGSDMTGVDDRPGVDFMINYFFYYPYNLGKKPVICPSSALQKTVPFRFGNHIGDWERVTVLFKKEGNSAKPVEVKYNFHQWANYYNWKSKKFVYNEDDNAMKKFREDKILSDFSKEGNHPVGYVGKGGHGTWTATGDHEYQGVAGIPEGIPGLDSRIRSLITDIVDPLLKSLTNKQICPTLLSLADETGKGPRWNTYDKVVLITEDMWQDEYTGSNLNASELTGTPITNWFTQIYRWGNDGQWKQPDSCGSGRIHKKICIPSSICRLVKNKFPEKKCKKTCIHPQTIFADTLGECRLNSGPGGPLFKHQITTAKCTTPPCRC